MIARIWNGRVPAANDGAYLDRMRKVALPDYRSISGNRGAYCLHRLEGDIAHFEMLTFWEDIDAIKRFAGEDCEVAKYYAFDRSFLLNWNRMFVTSLCMTNNAWALCASIRQLLCDGVWSVSSPKRAAGGFYRRSSISGS
jgi:hypothetical protein